MAYTPGTPAGMVRLLSNDVDPNPNNQIFSDDEIDAFLALEGGAVKLAAAQAIDTMADNEALCSKVIRTQDLATDGAKLADTLHKRAQALRDAHDAGLEADGYFGIIEAADNCSTDFTLGGF